VHGSASTFEIKIPDKLHILGVEGNGIKKWEVIGGKDKTALIQIGILFVWGFLYLFFFFFLWREG
jgi:hypothetical protein